MIRHWSFYDKTTGLFTGQVFGATDESVLTANIPEGQVAIEGQHDHLSRRVDLATGSVVDYQPPAPSDDHEWDPETKRWKLTAQAQAYKERSFAARARISHLEASVQPRALREAQLNRPGSMKRLQEIDDEIAALRMALTRQRE